MVRPTEDDGTDNGSPNPHDASYAELARTMNWLEDYILHATPKRKRKLRTNEYESNRAEWNIEHAYSVLAKLEEDAAAIRAPARRQRLQEGLRARKDTVEDISRRIQDLRHMAHEEEQDDDFESWAATADVVDHQEDTTKTHGGTSSSAPVEALRQQPYDDAENTRAEALSPQPTPRPAAPSPASAGHDSDPPTHTSQTLRARSSHALPAPATHSALRAALFANRRPTAAAAAQPSTATAEALLDQQRAEQDALLDSILRMARALKASSQSFSSTLDADKSVLGAAVEGIDKTEKGIEAARGRMGALRRMTEGRGWWGRMMLFAWVYGMMLALLLLVFVMPKLRF